MKYIFVCLGLVSLCLGVAGIFLPVLPTTPFLLLSAALFARSSKRLHGWLLHHRILGTYIASFLHEKAIPLRIKIYSVSLMWASILYTVFFVADGKLVVQIPLCLVAVGVTIHILSYKTKK
ncbi:MAG: YbaN family protein [Prevotellaceae bacterium]|jgi:uncharacterized membrane protein YbaN (DUF454 family)|nr:YbaN family protein [Prevotellaceae bacterium]